jgi:hypothetical protein
MFYFSYVHVSNVPENSSKALILPVHKKQSMFVFLDNIIKIQATTYIKLCSTSTDSTDAVRSRHNSERKKRCQKSS